MLQSSSLDFPKQNVSTIHLPFEHPILLKRLFVVDICFASDEWVLCIECPAFCKGGIIRRTIQPANHTTAAVTKMLNQTLDLGLND